MDSISNRLAISGPPPSWPPHLAMTNAKEIFLQTACLLVLSLCLVLLAAAPIAAQANLPNEMLRAASDETGAAPYTAIAARLVALPDAPAPRHRVIDKKFNVVMGSLAGAEALRFTTHTLVLDHEHDAGAPWVASAPSNSHLVAKYGAIYAAELLVVYELKKPHAWLPGDRTIRKFWWAYPATMIAIHTKNAIGSILTQAPSGCPVAECGPQ